MSLQAMQGHDKPRHAPTVDTIYGCMDCWSVASLHLWYENPDTELLHSYCCPACAVLLKPVHDGASMSSVSAVCSCILWSAAVNTIPCA
jgi:hypothetical protein